MRECLYHKTTQNSEAQKKSDFKVWLLSLAVFFCLLEKQCTILLIIKRINSWVIPSVHQGSSALKIFDLRWALTPVSFRSFPFLFFLNERKEWVLTLMTWLLMSIVSLRSSGCSLMCLNLIIKPGWTSITHCSLIQRQAESERLHLIILESH